MKTIIQTNTKGELISAKGTCIAKEIRQGLFNAHQTVREVKK